jgi:hypothetical protein
VKKVSEGFFGECVLRVQELLNNKKGFGSKVVLSERIILCLMIGGSFLLTEFELFLHEILLHGI